MFLSSQLSYRRRPRVVAFSMLALVLVSVFGMFAAPTNKASAAGWNLTWSDSFDGSNLDTSKWNAVDHTSDINSELQYYTPEGVAVNGGNLLITSEARSLGGRDYTSGMITTQGKFSFTYGRVEVRAKLPFGQGIWPAFWLLDPACNGYQPCEVWPPEIDIMEMLGHEPTKYYQTLHYGRWPDNGSTQCSYSGPDLSAGYHTYEVVWDPYYLEYYLDGNSVCRITENIPSTPMMLIMNIAVGGSWPGNPDGSTVFPQTMSVEHVNVYTWQN